MNRAVWLARDKAWSQRLATWAGHGRFRRPLAWILARSGDSLFWLAVIAWLLWQKQGLGWDLLWTVAATAVFVVILKGIFRRQRPKEKWAIATDKYSFPSGHASRATAVAITLAFAFPAYSLLWLLWAILVSLARVALSRHFLSDVAGGLIVGVGVGFGMQMLI